MEKLSKISKIFLFIFSLSGAIWLGSYITRLSVFYRLFESDELVLKEFIDNNNLNGILKVIIAAIPINMIFFSLMIVAFYIFIITSKLNLKTNGWLFISLILITITFPFELYLMTIDYKILNLVLYSDFDASEVIKLIISRFTVLSSFPLMELLSYFSIIYLFIFQPLLSKSKKVN